MQALFDSLSYATTTATAAIFGGAAEDNGNSPQSGGGPVPRPRIFTSSQAGDVDHLQGGRRLKVLIRGARRTGKSTLFRRLQGLPAVDGQASTSSADSFPYTPSTAIDVMRFSWSRNNISASLDVWDVVDHGTPMPLASSGYSFSASTSSSALTEKSIVKGAPKGLPLLPIDATTIDVYRGGGECDLVIFLFDRSRRETFEYVKEEVKRVPKHVPIIVGSNFSDKPRSPVEEDGSGADGVAFEDELALVAQIQPALSPFVQQALCGAHFSTSPSTLAVPPLLLSFCLPCGYGMRPLHAAFEAIVAFHRAKELETQSRICYELAAKAQSDAMKEEEEQTFRSYVAVLRMMDRQNGTTESANIPRDSGAAGGSPDDEAKERHKARRRSKVHESHDRGSSVSSYSTAVSDTSASEEEPADKRDKGRKHSKNQKQVAQVVKKTSPTLAKPSRPAPPTGFQPTRFGADASVLDTSFATALQGGGSKQQTIEDFLADVGDEDEIESRVGHTHMDENATRNVSNTSFLEAKSTVRGSVSAVQDSADRRDRLLRRQKEEEEAAELAAKTLKGKSKTKASKEFNGTEVKALAQQFEQHLEAYPAASDEDVDEREAIKPIPEKPVNVQAKPSTYQEMSFSGHANMTAKVHKDKKQKKDRHGHHHRAAEEKKPKHKSTHKRESSADSNDSFNKQFMKKKVSAGPGNPPESRFGGISSYGVVTGAEKVGSYQQGQGNNPTGGYLGSCSTNISAAANQSSASSKINTSHANYYDALPSEGKGLLSR